MSSRDILDTSIVVSLFRYFYKCYGRIEQKFIDVYHSSQICGLLNKFWKKTKVCFRYSFWARITEIKEADPAPLDNSRAVRYLINFYKRWRDKTICYLRPSFTLSLAKDTKEELILSPVRIVSIITTTAILVNVVLSILLQKQIALWGWLMRVLFLFAGISELFCRTDWLTIKQSSVFLRKAKIN